MSRGIAYLILCDIIACISALNGYRKWELNSSDADSISQVQTVKKIKYSLEVSVSLHRVKNGLGHVEWVLQMSVSSSTSACQLGYMKPISTNLGCHLWGIIKPQEEKTLRDKRFSFVGVFLPKFYFVYEAKVREDKFLAWFRTVSLIKWSTHELVAPRCWLLYTK